jgi:uncharacterized protein (DUF433 family)
MIQYLRMPMYPAAMVGRLVKLSSNRVQRWLKGYEYSYTVGIDQTEQIGYKGPIVNRENKDRSTYASFLDLIDLLFVKEFLSYGLSLQKIRKGLIEAEKLVGGHHFAQRTFFTDGKNIYLQVKEQGDNAILELLSGGQWVIAQFIKDLAYKIEFDKQTGFAQKWFPLGKNVPIVIDPAISFGQPSILGKGISTANIYDFYNAENEKIPDVCTWLKLQKTEVKAAVEFEQWLAAA